MSTEDNSTKELLLHFHMAAALAIYESDGQMKQRHVNVMMETVSANISRHDLDQINQGVIARIVAENGIDPKNMKDIVILTISRLAVCTRQEFYQFTDDELSQLSEADGTA